MKHGTRISTSGGAVAKTAIGGDIGTLDSGSFGPVTIPNSVTIDGTGSMAIIVGAQSSGITINLTNPADTAKTVRIRGVSINGLGAGMHGINVLAAIRVSIEDTIIDGFSGNGVSVVAGQVFIRNTTIRNNANLGIKVAAGAQVGISDVSVVFNGTGLAGPIVPFNNIVLYANKSGPVSP